ncbi:methyltransferase [Ignicoccus pacificus DSM 13166]|uniref:Methyltransferase n=1 Tax=Ignicoccus pacificus DSM 13166 TaxID=940294 RepID=A0A977K9Z0_9CREN|nr:methyltransferase [Ignicoccus pacificus DSM 13166]
MHYYKKGKGGRPRDIYVTIRGVDLVLQVPPGLFSSKGLDKGTELLLEFMEVPEEGKVLDVGCGYGVVGLFMKKYNPKLEVYMVDVNPQAVKISKLNAQRNSLEVNVIQGDTYEPLDRLGVKDFTTIVSNPPLAAGKETVERIIRGAPERLRKGGSLQVVLAKGGEWGEALFKELFKDVERKRKKGYTLLRGWI